MTTPSDRLAAAVSAMLAGMDGGDRELPPATGDVEEVRSALSAYTAARAERPTMQECEAFVREAIRAAVSYDTCGHTNMQYERMVRAEHALLSLFERLGVRGDATEVSDEDRP